MENSELALDSKDDSCADFGCVSTGFYISRDKSSILPGVELDCRSRLRIYNLGYSLQAAILEIR